jgi:hypothetical protein
VALGEADDEPLSWRHALHKLLKAGKGGATLEGILSRWGQLPKQLLQELYEEAALAASRADWQGMEARLQRALDAAAEDARVASR